MRKISTRAIITRILLFTEIPLIVLLLVLFSYTIYQNRARMNALIDLQAKELVSSMDNVYAHIFDASQNALRSYDFMVFANSSNKTSVAQHAHKMSMSVIDSISIYPDVSGVILYNSGCESTFVYMLATEGNEISKSLSTHFSKMGVEKLEESFSIKVSNKIYLVRSVSQRYGNVFVILDPTKNGSYQSVTGSLRNAATLWFSKSREEPGDTKKTISLKVESVSLYLNYQPLKYNIFSLIDTNQRMMLFTLFLIVALIGVAWVITRRLFVKPLKYLSDSFDKVAGGNRDYRIHQTSRVREIDGSYIGFNQMMDHIRFAERESFAHQMDAAQAKLQYLQLQIRPHFYLNCLKNINSLAQMGDTERIQDLVIYLSEYFRYNFQDVKNYIPLQEELGAMKSYVNLINCMSLPTVIEFELDSETMDAMCLPITLLTFIENSFKHGKMNEKLTIYVKTEKIQFNGSADIQVTITDDGGGFPVDVLEELNQADPSKMVYRRNRVGISNVRYRLWLIYREKAFMRFRNDCGKAVAEIVFPYEKYMVSDEHFGIKEAEL